MLSLSRAEGEGEWAKTTTGVKLNVERQTKEMSCKVVETK